MIEETIGILEETPEELLNIEDESEDSVGIQEENVTINEVYVYDKNYLHVQDIASAEWNINHNLGKYPSVTVIDSAGSEVIGEIEYIDTNNVKIKFASGFSGKATLN